MKRRGTCKRTAPLTQRERARRTTPTALTGVTLHGSTQVEWTIIVRRYRSTNKSHLQQPWLTSLRLTTTRPARQRWAAAESRSFERCVPTTSCRDRAPASSIPLRAHGPPAAHICTSTTAMRTRCGEGDLVGGWHAGASPFTPITRWVTKGGSSSASLAHTYTPLGRSQRL